MQFGETVHTRATGPNRPNSTYVGKTVQHLGERIKQHIPDIPDRLFVNLRGKLTVKATSDSAITCHLQDSEDSRHLDRRKDFKIIARARHSQHLDVLEALRILEINHLSFVSRNVLFVT